MRLPLPLLLLLLLLLLLPLPLPLLFFLSSPQGICFFATPQHRNIKPHRRQATRVPPPISTGTRD